MGKLEQQIAMLDKKELIETLTRAYADEWYAHYN